MSQHIEITTTASTASASSARPAETTSSTNYLLSSVRNNLINASEQQQQDDLNNFVFHFSWLDYGFFVGLLSLSIDRHLLWIFFQTQAKQYCRIHSRRTVNENFTRCNVHDRNVSTTNHSARSFLCLLFFPLILCQICFSSFWACDSFFLFTMSKWWAGNSDKSNYPPIFFLLLFIHSLTPVSLSFPVIAIYQVKL